MNHLPLETGRHYVDGEGCRVVPHSRLPASIRGACYGYQDVAIEHIYDPKTGVCLTSAREGRNIVGYWTGAIDGMQESVISSKQTVEPLCHCSAKALLSFGHEKGCAYMEHKSQRTGR